jgi:hypothetical protein
LRQSLCLLPNCIALKLRYQTASGCKVLYQLVHAGLKYIGLRL